jgi:hypothetical protein
MKSSRHGLVLLILCLLPAAASGADIPLSTSGWSYFSPGHGMTLLPGGGYAAVWTWMVMGGPYAETDVRMQWVRPDGSLAFPKGYREVSASSTAQENGAVIAPHPRSGVFVAFDSGDGEVKTDVVVQRYDGAGKRLWRVVAAVEEGRRIQTSPTLVPDAEGGVYVCFASFPVDGVPGSAKTLCQHLDANGRRRWSRQGLTAGGAPGMRGGPQGMTDGQGGLLVVWRNERSPGAGLPALIEGQRFTANGIRLWGKQGRLLHRTHMPGRGALYAAAGLRAVSDGEGGALLAFDDLLSEAEPGIDVVAQRVGGAGNPLWGSGAVVAEEAGTQTVVDLVAGPSAGACILFRDDRPGHSDLAIHRVHGTGGYFWQIRLSAPDTYDTYGFGDFDGDLLRIVWTRHSASAPSQVRLLVTDVNGNRLNGPAGELLAETASGMLDGFVYDRDRGQGFAVWSFGSSHEQAAGVLVDGQP